MGVYPHPHDARLRVAYTWFGSRVPTPRWLDDEDHALLTSRPRLGRVLFNAWIWGRAWGVIRLRLWGRA